MNNIVMPVSSADVTIRPIAQTDIPAVAECHLRAWQAAFRGILSDGLLDRRNLAEFESSWLSLATKAGRINLVADGTNGVLGYVAAQDGSVDHNSAGEIMGIYVTPNLWRTGIGRRLLHAAFSHLAATGYRSAFLWTMEANQRSRRFYESCGMSLWR